MLADFSGAGAAGCIGVKSPLHPPLIKPRFGLILVGGVRQMSLEAMPLEGQIEFARTQLRETHDLLASASHDATTRMIEAAFELTLPNVVDSPAINP